MAKDNIIDVLCITSKLCIGGVQTYLINYIEPLLKYGIRLNFAVQTTEPQIYDEYVKSLGCRIFTITSLSVSKLAFMKDIRSILKSYPVIKIVHSHQNFANIYSLVASKGLAKTISHSHSNYQPKSFINSILKKIFKLILPLFADAYWACSDQSAKWLYGPYIKSKKCHIVLNAISPEKFKFNSNKRELIRDRYNLNGKLVWVHIGSFGEAKNHKFLIELFAESCKRKQNQHLLLCGDGLLRPQIEKRIQELGLSDKVTLLGNCKNPQDYLSAADLYVFPSLFEGFPLSAVEAQATGIKGVVSAAVPQQCIINPNVLRIESLSISLYIQKIEEVLKIDFDRNNGVINIENSGFSISSEAKKIANYYNEILN